MHERCNTMNGITMMPIALVGLGVMVAIQGVCKLLSKESE